MPKSLTRVVAVILAFGVAAESSAASLVPRQQFLLAGSESDARLFDAQALSESPIASTQRRSLEGERQSQSVQHEAGLFGPGGAEPGGSVPPAAERPSMLWVNSMLRKYEKAKAHVAEGTEDRIEDERRIAENAEVGFLWYMVHLSGFLIKNPYREIGGPSGEWLHAKEFFQQYYGGSAQKANLNRVQTWLTSMPLPIREPGKPAVLVHPELGVELPAVKTGQQFKPLPPPAASPAIQHSLPANINDLPRAA